MIKLECDRCGCVIRKEKDINDFHCNLNIKNGFVIFRSGLRESSVSLCKDCFKWLYSEVLQNREEEVEKADES